MAVTQFLTSEYYTVEVGSQIFGDLYITYLLPAVFNLTVQMNLLKSLVIS